MKGKIYFDYAATTPVKEEVAETIKWAYGVETGRLCASDDFGRNWRKQQREQIAKFMGCSEGELLITACGSQSNNYILSAICRYYEGETIHLMTTTIEHASVLESFKEIEKSGHKVTFLPVDSDGHVSIETFEKSIRPETKYVSMMFFNNEIGCRQNIEVIGQMLREKGIFFHVDGIQALSNEVFDVSNLPIDAMSVSAHKIYGPKGIAALYIRGGERGRAVRELIIEDAPYSAFSNEGMLVENMPYLAGFSRACERMMSSRTSHVEHLRKLKLLFFQLCGEKLATVKFNSQIDAGHPGIVNIELDKIDADSALIVLDMKGFMLSAGSACSSGAISASHVLLALGLSEKEAKRCLRISFGDFTTEKDVENLVIALTEIG